MGQHYKELEIKKSVRPTQMLREMTVMEWFHDLLAFSPTKLTFKAKDRASRSAQGKEAAPSPAPASMSG